MGCYYLLAITVMGGLISPAVLTLVAVPYINLLIQYEALWLKRMWQVSGAVRRPVESTGGARRRVEGGLRSALIS